jgi:hypothetical protein
MPGFGQVRWKSIRKMLDACAEGYTVEDKTHRRWVRYGGHIFHLPLGEHGTRDDPEIQLGQVRRMVRHLQIDVRCAERELPQLR